MKKRILGLFMMVLFIFSFGGGIFSQGTIAKAIEGQQINAEDLNAECSAYDSRGILYFSNGNSIYKYKDNDISKVFDISSGDKFTIDQNNIIRIYNSEGCYKEESLKTNAVSSLKADQQQQVVTQSKTSLEEDSKSYSISYSANVEGEGWQEVKNNGQTAGTTGESKRIEAIKIQGDDIPQGAVIKYRTHLQDIGWQDWKENGQVSGLEDQGLRIESIQMTSENMPDGYRIEYRAHVQDLGWQSWKLDGEIAGTTGECKRIEALEIKIVKEKQIEGVSYQVHISNEGWKNRTSENTIISSVNNDNLEALKVNVYDPKVEYGISYRTHIQDIGWQEWKGYGDVSGTVAQGKAIEAFEVALVNAPSNYHIEYRANVKNVGWQDWVRDGQTAGTVGVSGRITAVQMRLVKDKLPPKIKYQSYVDGVFQEYVYDSAISGTTGQAKKIEGLKIAL